MNAFRLSGHSVPDSEFQTEPLTPIPDVVSIFQIIYESHPDAIIVIDGDRRVTHVNPAFTAIFGYSAKEIIGENSSLLYANMDQYRMQGERLRGNAERMSHYAVEILCQRKDGSVFIGEISGSSSHDVQGNLVWSYGTVRDVTERYRKTQQLLRSAELYKRIGKSLPHSAVLVFDHNMRFLAADGEMFARYGFDSRDIEGKYLEDVLSPQMVATIEPLYRATLADQSEVYEGEFDGKYWVAHSTPIKEGNAIVGGVLVIQDVTEFKLAQQRAEALNDTLEARIRERTAQLEAANENLDAFAHMVAHDLKTPLVTLINAIEIMQTDPLSYDEQQALLASAIKRARQLQNQVDDLLLLASTNTKDDVQLVSLDMAAIVESAMQRVDPDQKILPQATQLPRAWHPVVGYAPWLEAVWVNYLSNAIKYGGDPLKLVLGSEQLPNGFVRFWIQDNGRGIPPEHQDSVFQTMIRLKGSGSQGYGIGLTIVRRVVERLQGRVGVLSDGGMGSCFYFDLPRTFSD